MPDVLHIDIETYSSEDIRKAGAYRYTQAPDFEILMVAFALNNQPVECYAFEDVPAYFYDMLRDERIIKAAHNAAFERLCFRAEGYDVAPEFWRCTAIKSAYVGLPLALADVSKILGLGDKGKLSTGTALIRYFCGPVKATKVNGGRTRNLPEHDPEKWEQFKQYCINDVEAEREIAHRLRSVKVPASEWGAYALDQRINDRGVRLDMDLAARAIELDKRNKAALLQQAVKITGLDNPNSLPQLKAWIYERTGLEITSLAKGAAENLRDHVANEAVTEVLELRLQMSRTSVKKYEAMRSCVGSDGRARGLFQFYGAGRTGRWAGRLIQLQNLPRNYMEDLAEAREAVRTLGPDSFECLYEVSDTLSQLIRTAIVPAPGHVFAVADFSAIEARVLAWLAGETWRLDVFRGHGKIYEASASRMFGVPLDEVGPELRSKGKVAELALGYQGGVGALKAMGGESMGLSESDMQQIVDKWRESNSRIRSFWYALNKLAVACVKGNGKQLHRPTGIYFWTNPHTDTLHIELPSGRALVYWKPRIYTNKFGQDAVQYMGTDGVTRKWVKIGTYGGKLTENIVQAVARDLLLHSMQTVEAAGFEVCMHVHDEIVAEIRDASQFDTIIELMQRPPDWAEGFPLGAAGYTGDFYKKD